MHWLSSIKFIKAGVTTYHDTHPPPFPILLRLYETLTSNQEEIEIASDGWLRHLNRGRRQTKIYSIQGGEGKQKHLSRQGLGDHGQDNSK